MLANGWPIHFILIYIVCCHSINAFKSCKVEDCSKTYSKTKEYEYLVEASSERYCQVLQTYIKCLNDSLPFCRGHLQFHSLEYLMKKQWKDLKCANFQIRSISKYDHNRCHFLPAPAQRNIRYCAVYGQLHVRRFDGLWNSCSDPGSQAVIDNRYFLVQITNTWMNKHPYKSFISHVTVILRPHNCTLTKQLTYSASYSDNNLPISFVDGTTAINVDGNRRAIEVLRQSSSYIELNLRYIDSSIHIRKQGNYLSVSIRSIQFVLHSGASVSSTQQLCTSGCRPDYVVPLTSTISMPETFSQCYSVPIKIPLSLALEKCLINNVTDSFLDTCTYDLLLTGNENVLSNTVHAQHDFQRVFPLHYHYITGRRRLLQEPIKNNNSISEFNNCFTNNVSSQQSYRLVISVFVNVFLFLLI